MAAGADNTVVYSGQQITCTATRTVHHITYQGVLAAIKRTAGRSMAERSNGCAGVADGRHCLRRLAVFKVLDWSGDKFAELLDWS